MEGVVVADFVKMIDYTLCRKCSLIKIGDCKVLSGENVARQYRMSVG